VQLNTSDSVNQLKKTLCSVYKNTCNQEDIIANIEHIVHTTGVLTLKKQN